MMNLQAYLIQRISALIMAPLVLVHLAVIVYAIQGGLTAEEILSRTLGSVFWGFYYTVFVLAAGVHAAIGLRTVLFEWTSIRRSWLNVFSLATAGGLVLFGLRAVFAVTMR